MRRQISRKWLRQGRQPLRAVARHEATLFDQNTTFKVEYRYDGADSRCSTTSDGSYKKSNHLFGASVVVSF